MGRPGDVLLALSTSGNSRNLLLAVEEAKRRNMGTLALLGKNGGALLAKVDTALVVPPSSTQRIQEIHITIGHIICGILERKVLAKTAANSSNLQQKKVRSVTSL